MCIGLAWSSWDLPTRPYLVPEEFFLPLAFMVHKHLYFLLFGVRCNNFRLRFIGDISIADRIASANEALKKSVLEGIPVLLWQIIRLTWGWFAAKDMGFQNVLCSAER